jgi:hypothetical protein
MSGTVIVVDTSNVPIPFGDQTKQSTLISVPAFAAIQRPADATPYAVGDLIANSVTAGSVTPLSWTGATITGSGGTGEIAGVMISSSAAVSVDSTIRVHFFITTSPTVGNGDNGAIFVSNFANDKYIGFVDVVLPAAGGVDGTGPTGFTGSVQVPYKITTGDTIYGLLEARTAFTPPNAGFIGAGPRFRRFS